MKLSRNAQNTLLVLGSLILVVLIMEGVSVIVLKTMDISYYQETPQPREIWSFDDARMLSSGTDRRGDIAKLILAKAFENKSALPDPTPEDRLLMSEIPEYLPSNKGRSLWPKAQTIQSNLDDDFILRGSESKKIKYKAHYTTDEFGRRKAWVEGKKNILFLGCSFTFGLGVNDEETFPYLIGKELGVRTYNTGIPGASPSVILKRIREDSFPGDISAADTTVILTLIPEHLTRVIGTLSLFQGNFNPFAYYPYAYEKDGQILIKDSFAKDPTFRKHFLYLLSFMNFPKAFKLEYPRMGVEQYKLFAQIIRAIESELRKKYPQIKEFIIALYPAGNARTTYQEMKNYLTSEQFKVFDYTFINGSTLLGSAYNLKYDGHPSPIAHEFYSQLLIRDLKQTSLP